MKRRQYLIAQVLLAVLLLLQLGSVAAAVMTVPACSVGSYHEHDVTLDCAGTSVALAMASHAASPEGCEDGGCIVHCATGLIAASVRATVASVPFMRTVPPPAYIPAAPVDRLDRPPKSFSR